MMRTTVIVKVEVVPLHSRDDRHLGDRDLHVLRIQDEHRQDTLGTAVVPLL